ncbi:hypothetical protein LXM26_13775 [Dyadobacter sp. LJ419]|uniref:YD repeat-containing protein n=1 Tax=Dyadobacter chenwenxiniae TaxID=2906456 RepID=A0A9X1PLF4_9BACT|nr:hypothetical protein [Dyadobacter chenwenxiniae]MCF0062570.1 hypothetical protein [Dyadobacter chenwenxiniae]
MRIYRSTFTFLVFLALSISCNKKKEDIKPIEKCRFTGKSSDYEMKTIEETTVQTYESNFKQDDQGRLALVTVSQTESRKNSTGIFAYITQEDTYEFIYNAEGFLTELKRHDVKLHQGYSTYEFNVANLRYKKGKVETTSVTSFIYDHGRAQSSKFVSNMVVQGDNLPAATFPETTTVVYKYDSKNNIQTATYDGTYGGSVVSFENGVRKSYVSADGKTKNQFDDRGRMISYTYAYDGAEWIYKYDQRGNQIFQEAYHDKHKLLYSIETNFDEHPNPDTMIPSHYKGIPEPIKIFNASDNTNNWVETTTNHTYFGRSVESNVWTYHANGLPATSTIVKGSDLNMSTEITKYNYENCN